MCHQGLSGLMSEPVIVEKEVTRMNKGFADYIYCGGRWGTTLERVR